MRRKKTIQSSLILAALCLSCLFGLFPQSAAAAEYDWYRSGSASGVYTIRSVADLKEFAALVNGTGESAESFAGKTILLACDLDLGEEPWTPIGRCSLRSAPLADLPFSGIFDGQGHTISGLFIDSQEENQALFGYVKSGTIRNLTVAGTVSTSRNYAAGLVAYQSGDQPIVIETCISEVSVQGRQFTGGLLGAGSVVLRNSENHGSIRSSGYAGGLIGSASNSTVENCVNLGAISNLSKESASSYLVPVAYGGLIGNSGKSLTMNHCANQGDVLTTAPSVGGLIGDLGSGYQAEGPNQVNGCSNAGTVSGSKRVGGLFGTLEDNTRSGISNCYNTGAISGENQIGGLTGEQKMGAMRNCFQFGSVSSTSTPAGAVSGSAIENINCYYLEACLTIAGRQAQNNETWSIPATAERFRSGEIAYLLDSGDDYDRTFVWSQGAEIPEPAADAQLPVYRVAVEGSAGGSILLDRTHYAPGETVSVSILPGEGSICQLVWAQDMRSERLDGAGDGLNWTFTMPESDVAVTARFIPAPNPAQSYEITLDANDGSGQVEVVQRMGGSALALAVPSRQGFEFLGWYSASADGVVVDPTTPVAEDMVLYARWKVARTAEVKFYWNFKHGPYEEHQWVNLGGPLAKAPRTPVRPDLPGSKYRFLGWFTAPAGGTQWAMEDDPVDHDMSLYAHWEEDDIFSSGTTPEAAVVLSTTADLTALAAKVKFGSTYAGCYFKLGNDLALGADWPGIGAGDAPFCGTLDGAGHTIQLDQTCQGLFASLGKGGRVHDVTITGAMTAYCENPEYDAVGVIADYCTDSTIENCQVQIILTVPEENQVSVLGGLAGSLNGTLNGCTLLAGSRIEGYVTEYAGGLIGTGRGAVSLAQNHGALDLSAEIIGGVGGIVSGSMSDCANTGTITNVRGGASGILGGSKNGAEITIDRCVNSGTVTGVDVAAGVLASFAMVETSNYNSKVLIRNSGNMGQITATSGSAGGILGSPQRSPKPSLNVEIVGCVNQGAISGTDYVGGIVGMLDSYYALGGMGPDDRESVTITQCTNEGDVTASGDYAGGIVGANTMYGALSLSQVDSSGDVSGTNYVGGIAGYVDHSHYKNIAHNVTSSGNITATGSYVGGLMGYGAVSDGYWNGSSITVGEKSRYVNELVGDIHSIVTNSRFDYQNAIGKDGSIEAETSKTEPIAADPSTDRTQPLPPAPQPEAPHRPLNPAEDNQESSQASNPAESLTEPQNEHPQTVFEVVREAAKENPVLAAISVAAFFLVLSLGIWHRYRAYRRET